MAKTSAPPSAADLGIRSASEADISPYHQILLVGPTGSGKSAQIWTLPGKKLVFVFDPNTMTTLQGCPDCDVLEFLPDFLDIDATLKGFNKGAKDDKPKQHKEPLLYLRFVDTLNQIVEQEIYKSYQWLVFDSLTFVSKAVMDRQLYINNRFGGIEDIADYRVVGSKLADVFSSVNGLPINIFSTGHLSVFQDDKTNKIVTQIWLPGKARNILPLTHSNVWLACAGEKPGMYEIQTVPEQKGLQEIRTSLKGLQAYEDVTIKDFKNATKFGIGALLKKAA